MMDKNYRLTIVLSDKRLDDLDVLTEKFHLANRSQTVRWLIATKMEEAA